MTIPPSFQEEHRQALDFLNQLAGENARFFGIEIGAVRIGDSLPAPLFKLRAQPNDWHSQVAAAAKTTAQTAGKAPAYVAFWTRFLDRVKGERPGWTRAHKPGPSNWLSMPSPFKGGPTYNASFAAGGKLRTELYIDYGNGDANLALFNWLFDQREAIEADYVGPLVWEELTGRRACRVADFRSGDVANLDEHDEYIDWFFDTGARLRKALAGPAVAYTPTASLEAGFSVPESHEP